MGKTNQKLTIWVDPQWRTHEKVRELEAKGHIVLDMLAESPDLILHPTAHQWSDEMWDYLEIALKAARKRKYPARKRKEK